MEYKYLVRFAHVNHKTEDVSGGVHHGPGEMPVTTFEPIETQSQKDDLARTIGRIMYEKHGVTGIAIQAIIPVKNDGEVIEVEDFSYIDHPSADDE